MKDLLFPVKKLEEKKLAIELRQCPVCGARLISAPEDDDYEDEFYNLICSKDRTHYDEPA